MSTRDFGVLKAAMARTASDNDAEALASIRAANRVLVQNNYTWANVFGRVVRVVNEIEVPEEEMTSYAGVVATKYQNNSDEELSDAFRAALDDARPGSFRDTLLSIQAQYESTGRLTERQREVVMDAARRAGER